MLKKPANVILHALATAARSLAERWRQGHATTRPADYKGWRITPMSSLSPGTGWSPRVRIAAIDAAPVVEKEFLPGTPKLFATKADADGYALNMGIALVDTALGGWRLPSSAEGGPAAGEPTSDQDPPTSTGVNALVRRAWDALRLRRTWGSEAALCQSIVERMDTGVLPTAWPMEIRIGYGRGGDVCSACDEPILPAQTEHQLEDGAGEIAFRLHPVCHRLWEVASRTWKPRHQEPRRRLA
jgi:hypothetical protein